MHFSAEVLSVENLTRFLNSEQESLCLDEEVVAKHMKEYLMYCGKDTNINQQFTETDVSKSYLIYIIQICSLIIPIPKITTYLNILYLSILFFE